MSIPTLLAQPLFAEQEPNESKSKLAQNTAPEEPNRILQAIPANVFFAAYTADIDQTITNPWTAMLVDTPEIKPILQFLADSFDGPFTVAVAGTPILPFTWRISVLGETKLDQAAINDQIQSALLAAWNGSFLKGISEVQFIAASNSQLLFTGPMPITLNLSNQDGVFAATNDPNIESQLDNPAPETSLINKPEWSHCVASLANPPTAFLYADVRAILPMASIPLNAALPKLYEALQLDKLQSVALIYAKPTPPDSNRPGDAEKNKAKEKTKPAKSAGKPEGAVSPTPSAPVLRLALSVNNDRPGLWHFLASEPTTSTLSTAFPTNTAFFVHGSMASAAALMNDITALQTVIDPAIVAEYNDDRTDFRRDVGFDPHADFLANFTSEWAFGGQIGEKGITQPLFAVRVADADRFAAQWRALRDYFKLETSTTDYRGAKIETAHRAAGAFSFALAQQVLLASVEPQAVADGIDALLDKKSLAQSRSFQTMRERTGPTSKFAYVNLDRIMPELRAANPNDPVVDLLAKALKSQVALAVSPREGVITADLLLNRNFNEATARVFGDSIKQARAQAMRTVAMANMRGVIMSCVIYANENKGQWPRSLQTLIDDGSVTAQQVTSPYEEAQNSATPFFLYKQVAGPKAVKDPASLVVLCEPTIHDGGATFGFMDGHVEWITGQRAEDLLRLMRR